MDNQKLIGLYYEGEVYPPKEQVYRALDLCPPQKTKVVILGQDPYHGPGQANGLAFSVNKGFPIPPSLNNIFDEMCLDLDVPYPTHGDLTPWAEQGVLLLNSILTVDRGKASSHANFGWEDYTDSIIRTVNDSERPVVFMLWGNKAKEKRYLIDNPIHLILEAAHPSPLSAYKGFYNCSHFSKANKFLESKCLKPIVWRLE